MYNLCWNRISSSVKYIENRFTMQGFVDWVFSDPNSNHKGTTGTNRKKLGGGSIGFVHLERFMICVWYWED